MSYRTEGGILNLSKLDKWLLAGLIRKAVKQGKHVESIMFIYSLLDHAYALEFTEDTVATKNSNLRYWLNLILTNDRNSQTQ
jgi:hypothetical protein